MAVSGFVCHCPDLRLYRYRLVDDSKPGDEGVEDYKFDEDELEDAIAAHLASENKGQADVMAKMTGLARVNPHKFVLFNDARESLTIQDPEDFWSKHDAARDGNGNGG